MCKIFMWAMRPHAIYTRPFASTKKKRNTEHHMDKNDIIKVTNHFNPSSPIVNPEKLIGRDIEKDEFKTALLTPGNQVVITGPRGIGKTSLINVVSQSMSFEYRTECRIHKCGENDAYGDIMYSLIKNTKLNDVFIKESSRTTDGFDGKFKAVLFEGGAKNLTEKEIEIQSFIGKRLNPQVISNYFKDKNYLLIIDEFDRVKNEKTLGLVAETLRYFADYNSESNLVLSGIDIPLERFFKLHLSNYRSTTTLILNKIKPDSLNKIIEDGTSDIGIHFEKSVKNYIIWFSDGLPFFTHYVSRELALNAVKEKKEVVSIEDLSTAIFRLSNIRILQVFEESYQRAIYEEPKGFADPMREYFKMDDYLIGNAKTIKKQLIHALSFFQDYNSDDLASQIVLALEFFDESNSFKLDSHTINQIFEFISTESGIINKNQNGNYQFSDPFYKSYVRMRLFHDIIDKQNAKNLEHAELMKLIEIKN